MENTLLGYFFRRLGFYFLSFIDFYFKGVFDYFSTVYRNFLRSFERRFGVFINLRYFFVPFWQEFSLPSYLLSIPIRAIRIIFGLMVLFLFSAFFILVYGIWIALPFYLIFKFLGF